jgi:hypothetical protein
VSEPNIFFLQSTKSTTPRIGLNALARIKISLSLVLKFERSATTSKTINPGSQMKKVYIKAKIFKMAENIRIDV